MTFGRIRKRLVEFRPGIPLDLLTDIINERYTQILDELNWERLDQESILPTTAIYETGTLAVTNGSDAVTGTLTVFTAGMTGRGIRISSGAEFYEFTYASATTATLDRVYEGEDDTAASFKIFQSVYPLPVNLRSVESIRSLSCQQGLEQVSRQWLNREIAGRPQYGTPRYWSQFMDDASDPPLPQIELYPIPTDAEGLPYSFTADPSALSATSTSLLPWVRPGALVAGCEADLLSLDKNYLGADRKEARFQALLKQMRANAARAAGPATIRIAKRHTQHRARRWAR